MPSRSGFLVQRDKIFWRLFILCCLQRSFNQNNTRNETNDRYFVSQNVGERFLINSLTPKIQAPKANVGNHD